MLYISFILQLKSGLLFFLLDFAILGLLLSSLMLGHLVRHSLFDTLSPLLCGRLDLLGGCLDILLNFVDDSTDLLASLGISIGSDPPLNGTLLSV